jgi:hypothetical protein
VSLRNRGEREKGGDHLHLEKIILPSLAMFLASEVPAG